MVFHLQSARPTLALLANPSTARIVSLLNHFRVDTMNSAALVTMRPASCPKVVLAREGMRNVKLCFLSVSSKTAWGQVQVRSQHVLLRHHKPAIRATYQLEKNPVFMDPKYAAELLVSV